MVAHTLDVEFRKGALVRSQNFQWISISFIIYSLDRLYKNLSAGWTSEGAQPMITVMQEHYILNVRLDRPMRVQPGGWAQLYVPSISPIPHPFSIFQGETVYDVVFFIRDTENRNSGTRTPWCRALLEKLVEDPKPARGKARHVVGNEVPMAVMGPYSSNFPAVKDIDQVVCIGLGSGIVPTLSLFFEAAQLCASKAAKPQRPSYPRGVYEWAEEVLVRMHRRRRARQLALDAEDKTRTPAEDTSEVAVEKVRRMARTGKSEVEEQRVQQRRVKDKPRVQAGERVSTFGKTLRARCQSVRGLLGLEILRIVAYTASLLAATLTFSWLFMPHQRTEHTNGVMGRQVQWLFYITWCMAITFLALAIYRAVNEVASSSNTVRGVNLRRRRVIVLDYVIMFDMAYGVVSTALHTLIFTEIIPAPVGGFVWPWFIMLAIMPVRIAYLNDWTKMKRMAMEADAPPHRVRAIFVVRDSAAAQSVIDLVAGPLSALHRGTPVGDMVLKNISVDIHITQPRSRDTPTQVPSELLKCVHVRQGRPDWDARLSALDLQQGMDIYQNADQLARGRALNRSHTRTQVYFCGNPATGDELGAIVARENVVASLAGFPHHISYAAESFSSGKKATEDELKFALKMGTSSYRLPVMGRELDMASRSSLGSRAGSFMFARTNSSHDSLQGSIAYENSLKNASNDALVRQGDRGHTDDDAEAAV